jgi:hypothetical protein
LGLKQTPSSFRCSLCKFTCMGPHAHSRFRRTWPSSLSTGQGGRHDGDPQCGGFTVDAPDPPHTTTDLTPKVVRRPARCARRARQGTRAAPAAAAVRACRSAAGVGRDVAHRILVKQRSHPAASRGARRLHGQRRCNRRLRAGGSGRRPASPPRPSSGEGRSPTRADGASGKPYASRGASGAVGVLTLLRCAPQRRRVRVGARWARRALRRGVGLPLERAAPPSGHVLPPLLRERGHAPAQAPRVRSEDAEGAEEQIQARTRGEHQAEGTRQWAASHARAAGGIDAPAR